MAVTLAVCLAPLNSTMLIVALPRITDDFDADLSSAGWLVTGYLIAVAALQTPAGKLGDRVGHRRLFLGGLVAFLATSVAAAAAPTLALLIVFRAGQGVAGAVVFPNGWAMLRQVVPAQRRGRRFGAVGSFVTLSAGIGPPLGDAVVSAGSWRSMFLVNLAFVIPALVIGQRTLPAHGAVPTETRRPFDLAGAAGWLVLLIGAATVLNLSVRSGGAIVGLVGGPLVVAFGAWFVRRELAQPDPVLQPRFFAHPAFRAVNIAIACSNLAMYVTFLAVPIILQRQDGGPGPGLVLSVATLVAMATSPVGGRLADRLGRRLPALVGLTLAASAAVPLVLTGDEIPIGVLLAGFAVSGLGLGLSAPAMQTTSLESVSPRDSGAASGMYSTSRYLGSILGSSILAAVGDPAGKPIFVMVLVAGVVAALAASRIPRHIAPVDKDVGTSTSMRPAAMRTG